MTWSPIPVLITEFYIGAVHVDIPSRALGDNKYTFDECQYGPTY